MEYKTIIVLLEVILSRIESHASNTGDPLDNAYAVGYHSCIQDIEKIICGLNSSDK